MTAAIVKSGDEAGSDLEGLIGKRGSIAVLASYAIGLLASPFLLDSIRPYLERHTESSAEASDAFIVVCCIAAGVVPLAIMPFIVIGRALMRKRAVRARSGSRP